MVDVARQGVNGDRMARGLERNDGASGPRDTVLGRVEVIIETHM